jgi:glycosyltransferase involved in cell wall biosynthesis
VLSLAVLPSPSVAYLINQYPKISHTFIRREIAALERRGMDVHRFSIRRTREGLASDEDRQELARTRVILDQGIPGLLLALAARTLRSPILTARATRLAVKIGWRSDRGLLRHFAYLAEACTLLAWLKQSGCTHVHAHFATNSTSVAMLCHALGGPTYSFTVHGPSEFDRPLMLGLSDKIERSAFVVAISNFCRGQIYRYCSHGQWAKVHVVRCGLDERFLQSELSPPAEQPRVVCIGRLTEQKGHLLLLEAVARLIAEGRELELRLVGDGELRPKIERFIAERGLGKRVTITGWASDDQVRAEIRAARVVVMASFTEGLPVVLTEALALGRAVLTTAIAGVPELVSDDCGWLIPAGSVEQLAEGLRSALSTPRHELVRMARRGQARVRELHDAYKEAGKLRTLFVQHAQ